MYTIIALMLKAYFVIQICCIVVNIIDKRGWPWYVMLSPTIVLGAIIIIGYIIYGIRNAIDGWFRDNDYSGFWK